MSSERHLFNFYPPWLRLGLWLCSDPTRELCVCFLILPAITEDVFDDFDANSILCSSQTHQSDSCSVLQSLHFCMCANWWCYRSAESDSTGTELQHTSWLGRRTAVCADSTSSWQRNKLYLHPFVLPLPNPKPNSLTLSACVVKLRRVNDIFASPYQLLCPLSFILIFSSGSCSFPWHSSTVQPAS